MYLLGTPSWRMKLLAYKLDLMSSSTLSISHPERGKRTFRLYSRPILSQSGEKLILHQSMIQVRRI